MTQLARPGIPRGLHSRAGRGLRLRRGFAAACAAAGGALVLCAGTALAPTPALAYDESRPEVKAFIDEVAARNRLDRDWVAKLVTGAEFRQPIIDLMSRPAERVRPWFQYRTHFLTERRIREGREFLAVHRDALEDVSRRYGVPAEIIVAIVGVETFYGRITGSFRVIDALATLAFDFPARAPYFRGELEQFLLLVREAKIDPLKATGSYAGAMGAPQFMPRSYRNFAVDGDADGGIDLWTDWRDVFESVANYMVEHGWRRGEPIYATADLFYPGVEGLVAGRLELAHTVDSLAGRGVTFETRLPGETRAMFVALRGEDGPTYRVGFNNFWVITRYNRSQMYALAVSELAEAIAAEPAPVAPEVATPAEGFVPPPAPAATPPAAPAPGAATGATGAAAAQ
ncbi:MAG: lytic murein transglycosylase B [Steroidobacteraceae bacterium]|jgi:membrane-bound lytic murein transglycosylase B|nr:lytic murein transglycosylase B [Steroidobacteraceae bacterium]